MRGGKVASGNGLCSIVSSLHFAVVSSFFFFFNDKLIIGKKAITIFFKLFRKPVGTNGKYGRESEIANSRQGRATESKGIY